MIEKELKYELNRAQYQKLLRELKPQREKRLRLVNYYFDDPNLRLRKKRYALRIRIIDGKTVYFTLKYPGKTPHKGPRSLKVRYEHEIKIPMNLAKSLLKGRKHITDVDLGPLRILRKHLGKGILSKVGPLGLIECRRTVFTLPRNPSFELEIDRCKIFNKKFYEVEVETNRPTRADKLIRELLDDVGIPYHPITRSKFGRFIEEWKRRNH